jgi:hypothetical protein
MTGELERSETLPPPWVSERASNFEPSELYETKLREGAQVANAGQRSQVWLQADQPPALVFGFLPAHASRLLWRKQKVPGSLLHPVAQPNAEVASTRIRSAAHRINSLLDVVRPEGARAVA